LKKMLVRWGGRDQGQCFIQVEAAVVGRMRAMRRPGESYSQVILRLVELETSDLRVDQPSARPRGARQAGGRAGTGLPHPAADFLIVGPHT
jgi:hypothetical protein